LVLLLLLGCVYCGQAGFAGLSVLQSRCQQHSMYLQRLHVLMLFLQPTYPLIMCCAVFFAAAAVLLITCCSLVLLKMDSHHQQQG
jgi:hypothetical protein